MSSSRSPDRRCCHERPPRVAYMMSRFPKLTETFILFELLAVESAGVTVDVYPLRLERTSVMHPEAVEVVRRAKFTPWISWAILAAHVHFLIRKPMVYAGLIATLFWANLGSLRYFTGAMIFFPKAVYLAHCMQRDGIDHIHAHFASHPAAVAFVIHRLTGIPYSFTAHGSDLHRDRHMLREKVTEAAFVVTVSEFNRNIMLESCGNVDTRIRVIRCGADVDLFHPAKDADPTRALDRDARTPAIYCVGTLHDVKGQTYLLDAVALLRTRGTHCELHFIGDGPDRQTLMEKSRTMGLQKCTTFHGRKTRQQVAELLRAADLVAAPSVPTTDGRKEGIPVALMEAMASGVAVVGSRLSGIPELIIHEKNGLLVTPRDVDGLATALQRLLLDERLRADLAAAGRCTIEERYDLDANARQLVRLFHFATDGSPCDTHVGETTTAGEMTPCA